MKQLSFNSFQLFIHSSVLFPNVVYNYEALYKFSKYQEEEIQPSI